MQVLTVTALPIYLPYDRAPIPFGDPISDISVTSSTTAVVTAPGYVPAAGDRVAFSSEPISPATTSATPAGITAGTVYFVISPSTDTFSISTTKGGSAVATTDTGTGTQTLHLLSNQIDGTTAPFKTGGSAVCQNLKGTDYTLQGANDSNTGFGNPGGPGSWNTIATVTSGSAVLVQLSYDWIRATSAGTLVLLQN